MNEGIPYFPFPCVFDDSMKLLDAEFGLKGVAIITKLYQRIHGERGYYCNWNDEVDLLFSSNICRLAKGDNSVSEVIKCALRRGIFDKSMYEKFNILTSVEIQKNYFKAVKRRTNVEVKKEYLLFSAPKNQGSANNSSENVCRNGENADRNQQSKVEESKGNESSSFCSENEISVPPEQPIIFLTLNDKSEYPIWEKDVSEWSELYPSVDILQELRNMKGWLNSNPSRRKTKRGIKKFINSWLSREQDNGGYKKHSSNSGYYPNASEKQTTEDEILRRAAEMGLEV